MAPAMHRRSGTLFFCCSFLVLNIAGRRLSLAIYPQLNNMPCCMVYKALELLFIFYK